MSTDETVWCQNCGQVIRGLKRSDLTVDLNAGTEIGKAATMEHIARCVPSLEKMRKPSSKRWQ